MANLDDSTSEAASKDLDTSSVQVPAVISEFAKKAVSDGRDPDQLGRQLKWRFVTGLLCRYCSRPIDSRGMVKSDRLALDTQVLRLWMLALAAETCTVL